MFKPKIILFIIISLIITDAYSNISMMDDVNLGSSTYLVAFVNYISLFILLSIAIKSKLNNEIPNPIKNLYKLWFFWVIFNLIRGGFLANDYWDWKLLFLSAFFFTFVPLVFFLGINLDIVKIILKFILKYLFPYGFLLIPISFVTNEELYSRIMIPISLFVLFIPYVKSKWKILIIAVMVISCLLVLGFRANIIKSTVSIILIMAYYFRAYIQNSWLQFVHLLLFAVPVVLLIMAISFNYNIFEETSNEEGFVAADNSGEGQSITADSRTFLYVEVFGSMDYTYEWLIGKSSIGSYRSDFFYDIGGARKGKRYESEVGELNILLKYGLFGVVIYSLFLFFVSGYAIRNSSNFLAKMIGIFIAFRWTFSFVEEYTNFDLNFFTFWLAIGLVSSNKFRNMTDKDIKTFFKFDEPNNSSSYHLS